VSRKIAETFKDHFMTSKLGVSSLVALFLFSAGTAFARSKSVAAPSETAETSDPEAGDQGQGQQGPQGAADETAKFLASLKWTVGPGKAAVGNLAEIQVPEGARFTDAAGTRKMLEVMHNPTSGSELGLLTSDSLDWFVIFEFEEIGYVKDADKEKLDSNAMLESLREGNEAGNEERKKRGWAPITLVGWHTAPFYNKETNNLEWCIKGQSQGHDIVNYNTRILGRGGVMSANLLVAPEALDTTLASVKTILKGFSYSQGQKYSEWKSGDKIAKYGLSALVVGGAVGVAAKLGFLGKIAASLGKLWKLVILGFAGLAAAIKGLIFGKKKENQPPPAAPTDGQ
jgi:uncharacterized membrane-anchored protein